MKYRYEQIAQVLEQKIINQEWQVGQCIPGEIALAKEFGVARSTIRETLNILQQKGVIEKKNGIGTFVKENIKQMKNPLLSLVSVGKMIEESGYEAKSLVHKVSHVNPDHVIAEKLALFENQKVVILNRERIAEDKSVAFSYNILPEKLVKDYFDEGIQGSIFEMLKNKVGVEVLFANTEIKGINVKNEWDNRASKILHGPILLLEQIHFDQKKNPVLYSFDYLRTDLIQLYLRREN